MERTEGLLDRSWVAGKIIIHMVNGIYINWLFLFGHRCFPWRNSVFSRDHTVRSNVWPNCIGADFHDVSIRGPVQGRHRLGDSDNDPAGIVRNVLRFRNIGSVRIGEERDPVGAGQLLSDAAAQRRDLADRGHAYNPAVYFNIPASDDGDHVTQVNADQRLVHHRTRCVYGLHLDHSVDSFILVDKFDCFKGEKRLGDRSSIFKFFSRLRPVFFYYCCI